MIHDPNQVVSDLEVRLLMQYLDPIVVPEQPDVDIVFVHGLNPKGSENHAHQTWTDDKGFFWPDTLLRQELPSARVLIFAYNSSILRDAANAHVASHARTLCDRLKNCRLTDQEKHRPLVFVAHSLGGLVVKQALVEADMDPAYKCLKASTYGLVFFATPHRGAEGAGALKVAAKVFSAFTGQPTNKLLDSLKAQSLMTEISSDQFRHQLNNYDILSLIERRMMPVKIKSWLPAKNMVSFPCPIITSVTAHFAKYIVDAASAKLAVARENFQDVDRNHSDICKFSSLSDPAYQGVGPNLKTMANKARQHVAPCDHTDERNIDELLKNIHDEWQNSTQRRIALVGLGGVGKTELCIEFIERLASQRFVLWLRASKESLLQQDLTQAARDLRNELLRFHAGNVSREVDDRTIGAFYFTPIAMSELKDTLKDWLKTVPEDGSRIVVILDDLDGLELMDHSEDYSRVFAGEALDLIYTARDPSMSDRGMLWEATLFNVPPLQIDEALAVMEQSVADYRSFRSQSSLDHDLNPEELDARETTMRSVVTHLGGVPAAVIMGSHYMKDILGSRGDLDDYKRFLLLWADHKSKCDILQYHRAMLRYRPSTLASFEVSLVRLQRNLKNLKKSDSYTELCLLLLRTLSALDVNVMSRHDFWVFKSALRVISHGLLDRLFSLFSPYPTGVQQILLTDETWIDECLTHLLRVSLLTERLDDGALILNNIIKACALLVHGQISQDQRDAVEDIAREVKKIWRAIDSRSLTGAHSINLSSDAATGTLTPHKELA
ncbi:MAG: hypothetical protein Q9178_007318 [Gyalolechia marmorata]